jgi:MFS-type transporter involved in bile tolerance (Atg22 family)
MVEHSSGRHAGVINEVVAEVIDVVVVVVGAQAEHELQNHSEHAFVQPPLYVEQNSCKQAAVVVVVVRVWRHVWQVPQKAWVHAVSHSKPGVPHSDARHSIPVVVLVVVV